MSMTGEAYVLLVGIGAEDLPLSDGGRGELSGLVRSCPDVFGALARIGRDSSIRGVIVDVGAVSSGQMEFFSLVRRVRRGLAVYVVAKLESVADRVGDAIEHGATGQLTDDDVAGLVAACGVGDEPVKVKGIDAGAVDASCAPPEPALSPTRQADVAAIAPESDGDGPVISQERVVGRDEAADFGVVDDEGLSEPARVPWLRYTDKPGRKAPSPKREPPASDRSRSGSGSSGPAERGDEHEPLLTDAELAALLDGDGLGDSPDEHEVDLGDNDGGSEALR